MCSNHVALAQFDRRLNHGDSRRVFRWASCLAACMVLVGCGETVITIEGRRATPDPTASVATTAPNATPALPADAGEPVDLELGLRLYLPLDEIEVGAIAKDMSGNGNDGLASESPPQPSPATPPVGFPNTRSLSFDGSQLLDLANPDSLNIENLVTVAAWIRPTALDGYRNIVAHGFTWEPKSELALRIYDQQYQFLSWDAIDHGASAPVPAGDIDNWHYLVGVYDGRMYRLYRDGALIAAVEDSAAPTRVDAPWAIGGRSAVEPDQPRPFLGLIDDVRVYDRALSAAEVGALFRR
jgi:hypothetical protein